MPPSDTKTGRSDGEPRRSGRMPSGGWRVLRVLGVSLLALWLLRALAGLPLLPAAEPPAPPPPGAPITQERFDELVGKGADLVRWMRAGVVSSFDERGIGVARERFLRLDGPQRDAICRSLRIAPDELRLVFDGASGARIGVCDAAARYVSDPAA